jgi:hypothetical protein
MKKINEHLDCDGNRIFAGDSVVLVRVSENLLRDLPEEDQRAIRGQVGKTLTVIGFDDSGNAEIEFGDTKGAETSYHTVWIEPAHLRKKVVG